MNRSDAEMIILWDNKIDTIATDALAPCVCMETMNI